LFERSEGSTYLYFAEIPNSLPPPPFGELEDIYYSGGHNPISYEVFPHHALFIMPKLSILFGCVLYCLNYP